MSLRASWFARVILPGFAFKAVVIGGGYATGRELAEYFLPSGPLGGLLGMALAALVWSALCILTFLFAQATASTEYHAFFRHLLGRFAILFELAFLAMLLTLLSVFAAAAGAIANSLLGLDPLWGAALLALGIAVAVALGNGAVEAVFRAVTVLLYGTYAIFLALCLVKFGGGIGRALASSAAPGLRFLPDGITYAAYNGIGAVLILPVLRHLRGPRDAILAGALCGPLAMLPAAAFYLCMLAFTPAINGATLPSDMMLRALGLPAFRVLFQVMIFGALLECGTGMVHAVNERVAAWRHAQGAGFGFGARMALALALLLLATQIAGRFGLVSLIAHFYRVLAWVFVAVYIMPLATLGLWRVLPLIRRAARAPALLEVIAE